MDKKEFTTLLKSVTIEMLVFAGVLGGLGYFVMWLIGRDTLLGFCSGAILGVMIALVSIYRRLRRYARYE